MEGDRREEGNHRRAYSSRGLLHLDVGNSTWYEGCHRPLDDTTHISYTTRTLPFAQRRKAPLERAHAINPTQPPTLVPNLFVHLTRSLQLAPLLLITYLPCSSISKEPSTIYLLTSLYFLLRFTHQPLSPDSRLHYLVPSSHSSPSNPSYIRSGFATSHLTFDPPLPNYVVSPTTNTTSSTTSITILVATAIIHPQPSFSTSTSELAFNVASDVDLDLVGRDNSISRAFAIRRLRHVDRRRKLLVWHGPNFVRLPTTTTSSTDAV